MQYSIGELIERFGGHIQGDPLRLVNGFAPVERAGGADIVFVEQARYLAAADRSAAGVLIVRPADAASLAERAGRSLWLHDKPYLVFARLSSWLAEQGRVREPVGAHPSAVIDPSARIAATATIGAQAVIGAGVVIGEQAEVGAACVLGRGVSIGDGTRLHARVTVYDDCQIGARSILHAGAVIGADGFGFANERGAWVKIAQVGRVRIGDDVEIGANTTIDRGTLDDTVIGNGVKLDNQIQIAHNVSIGDHTAMAACTGIAGSTSIGKHCVFGGAAMVVGHIEIADGVIVSPATVVSKSLKTVGRYTGYFPMDTHQAWERNAVLTRQLTDMRARIKALEQAARAAVRSEPDDGAHG